MKDLKQCREQLDSIDLEIIKLFEKRMSIIKDVAIYKKENNLPILDETREEMMLQKNLKNYVIVAFILGFAVVFTRTNIMKNTNQVLPYKTIINKNISIK